MFILQRVMKKWSVQVHLRRPLNRVQDQLVHNSQDRPFLAKPLISRSNGDLAIIINAMVIPRKYKARNAYACHLHIETTAR